MPHPDCNSCPSTWTTNGTGSNSSSACNGAWSGRYLCLGGTLPVPGTRGVLAPHEDGTEYVQKLNLPQVCVSSLRFSPTLPQLSAPLLRSHPEVVGVCGAGTGGPNCDTCAAGTWSAGGTLANPYLPCQSCATGRTTAGTGATASSSCTSERRRLGAPPSSCMPFGQNSVFMPRPGRGYRNCGAL